MTWSRRQGVLLSLWWLGHAARECSSLSDDLVTPPGSALVTLMTWSRRQGVLWSLWWLTPPGSALSDDLVTPGSASHSDEITPPGSALVSDDLARECSHAAREGVTPPAECLVSDDLITPPGSALVSDDLITPPGSARHSDDHAAREWSLRWPESRPGCVVSDDLVTPWRRAQVIRWLGHSPGLSGVIKSSDDLSHAASWVTLVTLMTWVTPPGSAQVSLMTWSRRQGVL